MNNENNFINQTVEHKGAVKNSISRIVFVALSLAIQIWIFWKTTTILRDKYVFFAVVSRSVAVLVPLRIFGKHMNSTYKISWIILVLSAPVFGVILYLLFGNAGSVSYLKTRMGNAWDGLRKELKTDGQVVAAYRNEDKSAGNIAGYLQDHCGFPVYSRSKVTYYGDTRENMKEQIRCLQQAEKYIFMEYFTIEDSNVWQTLEPILVEKVRAGVEVRVFYDDMGSFAVLNREFKKRLIAEGIDCRVFNPVIPMLDVVMDRRDHRKMTVIDGKIGFTGGYNLANEYFNITHPYGQWKDCGIKVEGEAVRNMVAMYLEMWSSVEDKPQHLQAYLPASWDTFSDGGYVQPYADSPMDDERVGENVYLNMIKYAKDYIYITTPYLIIDDEMERELTLAATRGVDVRIVTPGIPDKRIVYAATKSNYAHLAKAGVHIYQYTPGFIHAKQFVTDDVMAAVGTINLDFRSLYLHFEDGCLFSRCDAVTDVRKDCEELFQVSEDVSGKYKGHRNVLLRSWECILRLFSPLL